MSEKRRAKRRIGKGRTFQQRLDDEMQDFLIVYEQITRSVANQKILEKASPLPCRWQNVFDIDFESLHAQELSVESPEQIPATSLRSSGRRLPLEERFHHPTEIKRDAIRAVIKHYRLHKIRPRRFLQIEKVPVEMWLASGLIASDHPADAWSMVQRDDPIFWRTLLEIFCRTFDVEEGAPEFWNKKKYFELACDAVMLRDKLPKWSKAEVAKHLAKNQPYAARYVEPRANTARTERKNARGSAGIARRLAELEDWIGPLDVGSLGRLRIKDRVLFDDVFNKALGLTWL